MFPKALRAGLPHLAVPALLALSILALGAFPAAAQEPAIEGQVRDGGERGVGGVRLVLGCTGESPSPTRAESDAEGRFVLGSRTAAAVDCVVRSVDLADGLTPIVEPVHLETGETVRLDPVLRPGTPLTVRLEAAGRPVDDGSVLWTRADGGGLPVSAPVRDGEAHFSGVPAAGRLFYRGRVAGTPPGPSAGCRLLLDLFPQQGPIDPSLGPPPRVDLADADLRPVRISLAAEAGDSIRIVPGGARDLGSLDRVALATGDVIFPCVPAGDWVIEVRRRGEVVLSQALEVAPGSPAMELLDLEVER